MVGQPVTHFEVVGQDGDALRRYYGELFDWKFAQPMGPTNYTTVEDLPNGVGGGIGDAPEGYQGHVTFYVEVPDVGAALDKAENLGGTRMMGPDEVPGVGITIGLFNDPEGHTIGLVSEPS
jgi:predicted enzyme related to lactoylglutathione lyase